MKSLVLGGVKSGKSRYAETLAGQTGGDVIYIATATVEDEEMRARVAAHQRRRPADWQLIEEPLALAATLSARAAEEHCLLVDCLTLWLSNLLTLERASDAAIAQASEALIDTVSALPGELILVSNEVNMGLIPPNELGRRFCDAAGRLHQGLAARCDRVALMVAGIPLMVKG